MTILKFENIKAKNTIKVDNHQGFSINYIPDVNSLLVFGVLSTSDMYLFSLTKKQWTLIKTTGKKPQFRRYHSHYYDNSIKGLIIHGGEIIQKHKKPRSSDECYILFVSNWQWRKIFMHKGPSARQFHQIIQNHYSHQKELFIFGGFAKPYANFLDDLWSIRNIDHLSIKTNKHEVHGCQTKLIATKGQPPLVYGYNAKIINKNLLIFGGQYEQVKKRFEINSLCLKTLSWQKLEILNKICPSLLFPQVFESDLTSSKIHILGGLNPRSNKSNANIYYLDVQKLQILKQQQSLATNEFNLINENSCLITQSPLCVGMMEVNDQEDDININVKILYQKQQLPVKQKVFQTDQPQQLQTQIPNQIPLEQYLKCIKHQQILSQQLIKKNLILQQVYKQMQRYISTLYSHYLQSSIQSNIQIEREKQKNIKSCEELKQKYIQNAEKYQLINKQIRETRMGLGRIHEEFEKCVQTEIDQDDQQHH